MRKQETEMPKIREAKIKIESVIENVDAAGLPEGDAERNTTEVSGFINYTDEGILLTYSEENDGAVVGSADSASKVIHIGKLYRNNVILLHDQI